MAARAGAAHLREDEDGSDSDAYFESASTVTRNGYDFHEEIIKGWGEERPPIFLCSGTGFDEKDIDGLQLNSYANDHGHYDWYGLGFRADTYASDCGDYDEYELELGEEVYVQGIDALW